MENENIEVLRESLIRELKEYKEGGGTEYIYLDTDKKLLHDILFEMGKIAIPNNLWKLIDLSNVLFDGVDVQYIDFTGSKGAVINPQEIYEKSLWYTILTDVKILGSLDNVNVVGANFTGSSGAVINPQKIYGKSLCGTKLTDVKISGSLGGVNVSGADFTGSSGAKMTADEAEKTKELGTNLTDVEIVQIQDTETELKEVEDKIVKTFQKQLKK